MLSNKYTFSGMWPVSLDTYCTHIALSLSTFIQMCLDIYVYCGWHNRIVLYKKIYIRYVTPTCNSV